MSNDRRLKVHGTHRTGLDGFVDNSSLGSDLHMGNSLDSNEASEFPVLNFDASLDEDELQEVCVHFCCVYVS